MLTYISLFSGVGGFDLGFDRAGMACLAQVEFNANARRVLEKNWPNTKRYEDVRHVGKHNLPTPDVLCGGFPCQDVSVAGERKGLDGERSGLWFEFLRIITELNPRFVVIENVPGLLSSNKGRDFAVVLRGLAERGYCVAYRILDAQYFGVAQRRRRVFIVGSLGNGRAAEILFEPESSVRDIKPRSASRKKATGDSGNRLAANSGERSILQRGAGQVTGEPDRSEVNPLALPRVSGTLAASGAGTARAAGQENEIDFLIPFRMQAFGKYEQDGIASSVKARDYKDATDLVAFNLTFNDANGRRKDRPNGGMYVHEADLSHTLNAGSPSEKTVIAQAVDVRHLKLSDELSNTLQSKPNGGYSLNYTNPVIYGLSSELTVDQDKVGTLTLPSVSGGGQPARVAILEPKPDRIREWVETDDRIRAVQNDDRSSTAQEHVYFKPNAVINALEANKPSKTITRYGVRRLTPTETERLQGFPDYWTLIKTRIDSHTYQMMGNAVAVPVAEWIGKRIVAAAWAELWGVQTQP